MGIELASWFVAGTDPRIHLYVRKCIVVGEKLFKVRRLSVGKNLPINLLMPVREEYHRPALVVGGALNQFKLGTLCGHQSSIYELCLEKADNK